MQVSVAFVLVPAAQLYCVVVPAEAVYPVAQPTLQVLPEARDVPVQLPATMGELTEGKLQGSAANRDGGHRWFWVHANREGSINWFTT